MIIYGEVVPDDSRIPIRAEGLPLDNAFPELAKTLLDHVRTGLTIRKHQLMVPVRVISTGVPWPGVNDIPRDSC
jgi:hypothetical protein